jgi:hypothetical protein
MLHFISSWRPEDAQKYAGLYLISICPTYAQEKLTKRLDSTSLATLALALSLASGLDLLGNWSCEY